MQSIYLLLLIVSQLPFAHQIPPPPDHPPYCLVLNDVDLRISAVAQTAANVIFAIGLSLVPVLQAFGHLLVQMGRAIQTLLDSTIESVENLVASNWFVSYFLAPSLRNYTSTMHDTLQTMAANISYLGAHASGLLATTIDAVQMETVAAIRRSFALMHRDVVRRHANGTEGQWGHCHLGYANAVRLNAMASLQMFGVSCVETYRIMLFEGIDLVEQVIELVRWNVVNLVEFVRSSWHWELHKVYTLIRHGMSENWKLLTSGYQTVLEEFQMHRQAFVDCSTGLVDSVQLFVKHVNREIEFCLL